MPVTFNANGYMDEIYFNGVEMTEVYMNGVKVHELDLGMTISPTSYENYTFGNNGTTPNFTVSGAGNLYIYENSGPSGYFELEWYKNDVYQGYLVVWNGSGYDLGPGTITVADGDDIKFRVGQASNTLIGIKRDNSSGLVIFQMTLTVTP